MKAWFYALAVVLCSFVLSADEFAINAIEKDGFVRWHSLTGHVYTVQSREAPTGTWLVVPPEGQWPIETAEWLVNGGAGWPDEGQRFYRVMAEPVSQPPDGMVRIPGGTFTMGDAIGDGFSYELPLHEVTLSPFLMGETEVTKAEWDEVYGWALTQGYGFTMSGSGKGPDHPVQNIEWYDIVKWCNARSEKEELTPCYYTSAARTTVYQTGRVDVQNDWVSWDADGYRLPTEAEWEYATRGGAVGRRFPWSDSDDTTHSRANYYSSSSDSYDLSPTRGFHPDYDVGGYPYTSPVGVFAPNGFGLYDMAGNTWEWCWDWYAGYSPSPTTDPRGPDTGQSRVSRGGSWSGYARYTRVALRNSDQPRPGNDGLGFRLVRSAP